jgi:AbrB family looped-hinge helix DNA binding protein
MATTVLSEKGQLVIPATIRAQAGLSPGDRFTVEYRQDGQILLRRLPRDPLLALRGAYAGQDSLLAALLEDRAAEKTRG